MALIDSVWRVIKSLVRDTPIHGPARTVFVLARTKHARFYRRFHSWRRETFDPLEAHEKRDSDDEVTGQSFNESLPAGRRGRFPSHRLTQPLGKAPEHVTFPPHPDVENPILGPEDIPDALASYVADPFVVRRGDTFHMFFEIKDRAGDAYIAHAKSPDGVTYTYDRIILPPSQAQHSYPMVFHHDGEWYMTPSCVGDIAGQFRIYQAMEFPYEWELVEIPLEDQVRIDPTPFEFDGTWYLIFQEVETFDIVLWYSDRLLEGEWHEHPASPIFSPGSDHDAYDDEDLEEMDWGDPRSSEELPIVENVPSGRPLVGEDHVDIFYRRTVDGTLHHYRIDELSTDRFNQYELPESPILRGTNRDEWNGHMMHTVNVLNAQHGDRDIVLVDGLERERYVWRLGVYTLDVPDRESPTE